MQNLLLVSLFALALSGSGCVSIPNTRAVSVAGKMAAGGIWAETQTDKTGDLSLNELIDLIEPQLERTCVPVPGFNICADDQSHGVPVKLPKRGGGIIQSAEDWNKNKTALEQACRDLGSDCNYELQAAIKRMK